MGLPARISANNRNAAPNRALQDVQALSGITAIVSPKLNIIMNAKRLIPAIVSDIDGVILRGKNPIPGVPKVVRDL